MRRSEDETNGYPDPAYCDATGELGKQIAQIEKNFTMLPGEP